jgi:hypothetical protein
MSRWPDAGVQLERAVMRSAVEAGVLLSVTAASATPWASVTFTGARHRLNLVAARSSSLDNWLAGLAETEFRLRGHLVADLAIAAAIDAAESVEVTLEALTVEDC